MGFSRKGLLLFTKKTHFLRPWILGAFAWLVLSIIVSLEHLRTPPPHYLLEFSGLMSLLWMQFGFAGLFQAVKRGRVGYKLPFILITVLPPAILYLINFALAR